MLFALPFDMISSIFDWTFAHAPAVTGLIVFLVFAIWLALWISGYATRFRHVEADVAVLKQDMTVIGRRLVKMKKNLKSLETRMDGFEKRMDSFDSKLDGLDQKFTSLLVQLGFNNRNDQG